MHPSARSGRDPLGDGWSEHGRGAGAAGPADNFHAGENARVSTPNLRARLEFFALSVYDGKRPKERRLDSWMRNTIRKKARTRERTKGNLEAKESDFLESCLIQLKMPDMQKADILKV